MQNPLVSIICVSFNHANYIEEALNSIWNLDYNNIQLIIADDASTDESQQVIKKLVVGRDCELLLNSVNIGHCKTFNKALELAKGEYIIDLAADDILFSHSVTTGVSHIAKMGSSYGVFFADAEHIDSKSKTIGSHITSSFFYLGNVPQGDVYKDILGKYFICPPTMIYRKSVLKELNGYNETLVYEDFDFWVRSSRITKYCYLPDITVQKRIHPQSASSKQYIKNSKMLVSTLEICKNAFILNRSKTEDFALIKRLLYEGKMALFSNNYSIAFQMFILLNKVFFKIRS